MTNELKTRHLIVTLPDTSGEEADTMAESIEGWATCTTHGGPHVVDATVTHVLGETLPESIAIWQDGDLTMVDFDAYRDDSIPRHLTPYEARQLAGALLNIPGVADAEPPSPFQVVGEYVATITDKEV